LTIDTSTGLAWLNVSKTAGLSYNWVLSETQAGGEFSGFRFATVQEVVQLYSSAGLTPSAYGDTAGYYSASSPLIQTFFSLLGTSGTINGLPGIIALSGDSSGGRWEGLAPHVYGWSYAQEYWVSDDGPGAGQVEYGAGYGTQDLSSWLVKSVPEPLLADFLVLAAVAACGCKLLHRRERAA
jgi:hypothetical protein